MAPFIVQSRIDGISECRTRWKPNTRWRIRHARRPEWAHLLRVQADQLWRNDCLRQSKRKTYLKTTHLWICNLFLSFLVIHFVSSHFSVFISYFHHHNFIIKSRFNLSVVMSLYVNVIVLKERNYSSFRQFSARVFGKSAFHMQKHIL